MLNVVPGHGHQAARVRAAGREDALPLERRPQGDDRPAARRARGPAGGPGARGERAHDQRHARQGGGGRAHRRRSSTSGAPRWWSRSRSSRSARNKLKEYGIYLTSGLDAAGIEGIASGVFPDPRITNPSDGPYDKDNLVVTSLPGAVVRLLETDSSTRLLANPQLRISEGETAQARFGDQVPVPGHDLHRDRDGRHRRSSRSPRSSTRTSA